MKRSFILKLLTALSISGEKFGPMFNFLGNSLKLVFVYRNRNGPLY